MPICVPIQSTNISAADFTKSLIEVWLSQFGQNPSKQSCGLIYAQHKIECGNNATHNFNICNIKLPSNAGDNDKYYMLPGTWEILHGVKKIFNPPDRATWFVAYDTLNDGMSYYLSFLQRHYKSAFSSIIAGDPAAFVHSLKSNRYFTAPEDSYLRGVLAYYSPFMKTNVYEQVLAGENNIPDINIENNDFDFTMQLSVGIDDDQPADAGIDPNDAQS
jgi:hypothetical protein